MNRRSFLTRAASALAALPFVGSLVPKALVGAASKETEIWGWVRPSTNGFQTETFWPFSKVPADRLAEALAMKDRGEQIEFLYREPFEMKIQPSQDFSSSTIQLFNGIRDDAKQNVLEIDWVSYADERRGTPSPVVESRYRVTEEKATCWMQTTAENTGEFVPPEPFGFVDVRGPYAVVPPGSSVELKLP